MVHLHWRPAARPDADEAQAYYADIPWQLGEAFTDELLGAIRLLVDEPAPGSRRYAHLMRDGRLRIWTLDRFPFLLFYRFAENQLEIVRILHERRNISRGVLWRAKR